MEASAAARMGTLFRHEQCVVGPGKEHTACLGCDSAEQGPGARGSPCTTQRGFALGGKPLAGSSGDAISPDTQPSGISRQARTQADRPPVLLLNHGKAGGGVGQKTDHNQAAVLIASLAGTSCSHSRRSLPTAAAF
jgi:hypothetical protein